MRVVLFDLGDTLERVAADGRDVLTPGALETLDALRALRDPEGSPPVLALVSDFDDEAATGRVAATPQELAELRAQFGALLQSLGISHFFEPFDERVTLSAEAGVRKPDPRIFRTAVDKVSPGLPFNHVVFVTENASHVATARALGMTALKFRAPGQQAQAVTWRGWPIYRPSSVGCSPSSHAARAAKRRRDATRRRRKKASRQTPRLKTSSRA